MRQIINILMTGAGAPGGPGVLRCLEQDKLISVTVADKNEHAVGKYLNSSGKFWALPEAKSPDFIESVLAYTKKNNIDIIFPLVTSELFKLSEFKKLFESNGIKVVVSDFEQLKIANDKGALLRHLDSHGVPVPKYRIVDAGNFDMLLAVLREMEHPEKAVCIKPCISNGSRGVRIIDNHVDKFDLLFNYKPNALYTNLADFLSCVEGRNFPELLVTEVLPGEEYTVDSIINNGEIQIILPRSRTKTSGGISVEGEFVYCQEIINYCTDILKTMKLNGPIGLQVKQDENGTFKILEINPRIQGTSVSALGLGINLPLMAVYQELKISANKNIDSIPWGLKFSRYWQEVFYK